MPVPFDLHNLQMCFRATAPCHFSTSELQKETRCWGVCSILTWKSLWAHTNMHFFDIWIWKSDPGPSVSFLEFWLENALRAAAACNFFFLRWIATSAPAALASLLFDPSDPPIIEKNFATFVTLVCIFFLLILLSSDSASLLCFSCFYIVGSLTSNFIYIIIWITLNATCLFTFIAL